ncbi:MAG: hypothetical protein GY889_06480 [Proteobacteria bacterium]|nr:hypothetical protein [Halieaceae bacterium]MCP4828499.1 hypothetical protein [Pseudomonadota bacterium]
MALLIWVITLLVYLAFRLWYDGLRKPLTAEEVEKYSRLFEQHAGAGDEVDLAVMRKFLEEDDGKEFIMMNLLQYNPSPMKHPDTGQDAQADSILQEYFRPFMGRVIRRAGHPVIAGRAVGGYLDAWNTPPDPGWHGAGLIRYRSRRDIIELSLASAKFQDLHKYKLAALKQTIAFPTQTQMGLYASPRVTVAMALALAAALLQLTLT